MQRRDETDYFRRKWCESRQYFRKKENIQKNRCVDEGTFRYCKYREG